MAVASQIRHARPVVAEFLSLGEVAPSVQGLIDGDEVGEIDHGFGEAQGVRCSGRRLRGGSAAASRFRLAGRAGCFYFPGTWRSAGL